MMRKIHREALAGALKSGFATFSPAFQLASAEHARLAGCERRFSFVCAYEAGSALLFFEPAATARDNYFTVDLAWLRSDQRQDDAGVADALAMAVLAPWPEATPDDLLARPCFRLRIDELWGESPSTYRGEFCFSTASSRYTERMFSLAGFPPEEQGDRALQLLTRCLVEEKELAPDQALDELSPAVSLAFDAVGRAAIPAFVRANSLAATAMRRA